MAENADKETEQKPVPKPNFKFVTEQKPTDWSAQALLGRSVYNEQGESLGDINNVILNEKGDVVAVTIGVGGFLGLGEKDVGVPFDALEFKTEKEIEDKTAKTETDKTDANDRASETDLFDWEHSDVRVVLNATREQLEAAPTFVWLGQDREKRASTKNEKAVE